MKNRNRYRLGFSVFGLMAFIFQELPYIPWLLWPPADNPLANNPAANLLLGFLEQAGGILTIALLILITRKDTAKPGIKNRFFVAASVLLVIYYISWICYFSGMTGGWLIVIGLTAVVPLYYLSISLWMKNDFACITSLFFFVGHTCSNMINYLL